ncbi:hypothetical protein BBD46_17320 [Natrialba sp. SSL1]|nr:hypothetical protein BBD46_17320 [Natrialba sp. SSL1]
MSFAHSNSTDLVRYGLGVVLILLIALFLSLLFGPDLTVLAWSVFASISIGLMLAFLYLFYRLVLAIERIAHNL